MKKVLVAITFIISAVINISAEEIVGGPWNTIFGESTSQVEAKIRRSNSSLEIQTTPGQQINIMSKIVVAGETFEGGAFLFANDRMSNHFGMCMFNKSIQYENAFSNHLNYTQAEQWLVSNKYRVNQVINPIKRMITSKYGNPIKDSEDNIRWRSSNGNVIELVVERVVNMAQQDENFTRQYGCLPAYSILLLYVEGTNIPDF